MESSKTTNTLLVIIAICLVVIALKPAGFLADVSAQMTRGDDAAARFTSVTATDKAVQQQTEAIKAIATAIDRLADSGEAIAKSIDAVSRSLVDLSSGIAEGSAATAATGAAGSTKP